MQTLIQKLISGNEAYLASGKNLGDISPSRREQTAAGQNPYAVVLTCSDSRVIPEAIFSAGIGDLFVIRVAGNVATDSVLASVEYAVDHLGCQLVVVLGHTNCGAVDAALRHEPTGYVKILTDKIRQAISDAKDPTVATERNAIRSADQINAALHISCATPAVYDIATGKVRFL